MTMMITKYYIELVNKTRNGTMFSILMFHGTITEVCVHLSFQLDIQDFLEAV